jgi:hypothetical protein
MPLRLDPLAAALLPLVDGRNDRAALARQLRTLVKQGKLDGAMLGNTPGKPARIDEQRSKSLTLVNLVLAQLEQLALLEPPK